MVRDGGQRRSPVRALLDLDVRNEDRSLRRRLPGPTEGPAAAVWERMPEEHRTWARRAAVDGVVADHAEHALVVGTFQRHLAERPRERWVVVALLVIFGIVAAATIAGYVVEDRGLLPWWFLPVLLGVQAVSQVVAFSRIRRRHRRTSEANLARAASIAEVGGQRGT